MILLTQAKTHISETDFEEIDEYDQMPLAEFDYKSIQAVVTEPSRKHPAYGHPYSEYRKMRARTIDEEADRRDSHVRFWMDPIVGCLVETLARRRDLSLYSYINDMLEEGQIHIHPDFHDTYQEINSIADDMATRVKNSAGAGYLMKIRNQKISFRLCSRSNPSFCPRVANWLADDIKTVSVDLHMSISDVAYLYMIAGIVYSDATEMPLNKYHDEILAQALSYFSEELNMMHDICMHIQKKFDDITNLVD